MTSFEMALKSEETLLKHNNLKMSYSQVIKQQIFSKSGGHIIF